MAQGCTEFKSIFADGSARLLAGSRPGNRGWAQTVLLPMGADTGSGHGERTPSGRLTPIYSLFRSPCTLILAGCLQEASVIARASF